ncbi:hypothetical protein P8610_00035 [Fictibacillus sp. UD]|uniref:hypothetical protein n=1 Tax=Fictibacillus sp. UD TaxID=3038777 RepID=UPI003746EE7C
MKKRNRMVIFATAALLTVVVFNYNDFESKATATEQKLTIKNEVLTSDKTKDFVASNQTKDIKGDDIQTSSSVNISIQHNSEGKNQKKDLEKSIEKDQSSVNSQAKKSETKPVPIQPVENKSVTQHKKAQAQTSMPDTKVIDGYTYVNLMNRADENLKHLVNIAKKHDATLYAIEFSDCFAMFDNSSNQAIMMFSTGSRSVSIEKAEILCDMHPSIKNQIQGVIETGEETVVEIGEHESYHISKHGGNITISF